MDILKNKVVAFLGTLKNDLKKIAVNKDEVDKALTFQIDQVQNVFNNASTPRGKHHHVGMEFNDGDIIDAEIAYTMFRDDNPIRDMIRPEFLEELKEKERASVEKARDKWIALAGRNNEQFEGFMNEVLHRTEAWIYQHLHIKPIVQTLAKENDANRTQKS